MSKSSIFHHKVSEHDIKAAQNYLELLYPEDEAERFAEKLLYAELKIKEAKDILRASELHLLPMENKFVQEDILKAHNKQKMSPIILVRGKNKLIVADGFHRMCTAYYLGEETEIPCIIV